MTDDRYMEWKTAIAEARADGDTKRLNSLQLDYNLELGECLAHQSQRTKDIMGELTGVKEELSAVKNDISDLRTSVGTLDTRMADIETALGRTSDNVAELARSVRGLISYHHDENMKTEGVKSVGRTVKIIACGIAVVTGWGYAIYQAVKSFFGN